MRNPLRRRTCQHLDLVEEITLTRAELDAVRAGVSALLHGPYAPSQFAILDALYPSDQTIKEHRYDHTRGQCRPGG